MDKEELEDTNNFIESLPGRITIKYGRLHSISIEKGTEVKPSHLTSPPVHIIWPLGHETTTSCLYTLSMVDVDHTYIEEFSFHQFSNWLILNIPDDYINEGTVIAPYLGPTPKNGPHRLVVTIYKQSAFISKVPVMMSQWNRSNFDIREFAKVHGLGQPIAGTWFITRRESLDETAATTSTTVNHNNNYNTKNNNGNGNVKSSGSSLATGKMYSNCLNTTCCSIL